EGVHQDAVHLRPRAGGAVSSAPDAWVGAESGAAGVLSLSGGAAVLAAVPSITRGAHYFHFRWQWGRCGMGFVASQFCLLAVALVRGLGCTANVHFGDEQRNPAQSACDAARRPDPRLLRLRLLARAVHVAEKRR